MYLRFIRITMIGLMLAFLSIQVALASTPPYGLGNGPYGLGSGQGLTVKPYAGFGDVRIPGISYGTKWNPALLSEVNLGSSSRRFSSNTYGLGFQLALGSGGLNPYRLFQMNPYQVMRELNYTLGFNWQHTRGNGHASDSVPVGGTNVANTYIADYAGSTGVFLGAWGMDGSLKTKYELDEFDLSVGTELSFDSGASIRPRIGFVYDLSDTKHSAELMSPSFTHDQFASYTNSSIDEHRYGLGVGLDVVSPSYNGWSFYGGVGANLVRSRADLDVVQHNWCSLCGGAQTEFRVKVDDSDSRWTHDTNAKLGLRYNIDWLEFDLGASYKHRADVAGADSRDNPTELSPNIDRGSSSSMMFQFGVRVSF